MPRKEDALSFLFPFPHVQGLVRVPGESVLGFLAKSTIKLFLNKSSGNGFSI